MKYTTEQHNAFQNAFDHFNKELFDNSLPEVIINIVRKKNAHGYFWEDSFKSKNEKVSEIALNPETFSRGAKEIFSTLVHEMVHLWQAKFGVKKPKNAYHNKEWAFKMMEVGLQPTTTGKPDGKMTGKNCTHIITPNAPFEQSWNRLPKEIGILIEGLVFSRTEKTRPKDKFVYVCVKCDAKVWGKSGLNVICGDCKTTMEQEENEED